MLVYGTAWKEQETERLTRLALDTGFRAIDTANQRKHYFEAAVGRAVQASGVARAELFLQSKFTHRDGQDHRLPYDANAPVTTQVAQSFASTLEHFGTDYLDSYVMHGPSRRVGLAPEDWEAWTAMEALVAAKKARTIGVSNVTSEQLALLQAKATVKPAIVQNRCYASRGWDADVRAQCTQHGVAYQGFSLLTANPEVVNGASVRAIAARAQATAPQVVFAFALAVGMTPLTGTTSEQHMREDLAAQAIRLSAAEVSELERG